MPTVSSKRTVTGFAGTDSQHLFEGRHEYFAIANFAGLGAVDYSLDDFVHSIIGNGHLYFRFRQEIDDVLGAAIELGVAALTAKAFYLAHRHALNSNLTQGIPDVVESEGFYDSRDKLHTEVSISEPGAGILYESQHHRSAVDHQRLSRRETTQVTGPAGGSPDYWSLRCRVLSRCRTGSAEFLVSKAGAVMTAVGRCLIVTRRRQSDARNGVQVKPETDNAAGGLA